MTKRISLWTLFLLTLLMAGPAMAQDTAEGQAGPGEMNLPDPNQPEAASVLKHIPADCMAFFVAPNMNTLLTNVETYAKEIGLGEELGGIAPSGLLETMARGLQIGEGYNPNGGVALVVLDLKKAGIDLSQLGQPGFAPPNEPPVVLLVAGKDPKAVFADRAVENEDGSVSVVLIDSPNPVTEMGDYLAVSPWPNGLELMKGPSIAETLAKEKTDLINASLFAYYYNMASVNQVMKDFQAALDREVENRKDQGRRVNEEMFLSSIMMDMAGETTEQMKDMLTVVRISDIGVVGETLVDYLPNSVLGKQLASMKPADGKLIDRLPNAPYFMAAGSVPGANTHDAVNQAIKLFDMVMGTMDIEVPADLHENMVTLGTELGEQLEGMQVAVGAAKAGGIFGTTMLIECKDAATTQNLLAEKSDLLTQLVAKTFANLEPDFQGLQFKYVKGAETVGAVSVDAIEVIHPELSQLSERERKEMQDIFGEDKIRLLVAPVDLKTVVVTFSGSTAVLAEAIAAAQKGGDIYADAGVKELLPHLPKNRLGLVVGSWQNVMRETRREMTALGKETPEPIATLEFSTEMPVALTVSATGSLARVQWIVPTGVIADAIRLTKEMEKWQQKKYEEMRREWEAREKQSQDANDM